MKSIGETNYCAAKDGRIYNKKTGKFLKGSKDKDGYLRFRLNGTNVSIHRMVLETFSPIVEMHKMQVNHIDGNKQNNELSNLEWVTRMENMEHMKSAGLSKKCSHKGSLNPRARITEEEVLEMRQIYETKDVSISKLSRDFNLSWSATDSILKRKTWKHLE